MLDSAKELLQQLLARARHALDDVQDQADMTLEEMGVGDGQGTVDSLLFDLDQAIITLSPKRRR